MQLWKRTCCIDSHCSATMLMFCATAFGFLSHAEMSNHKSDTTPADVHYMVCIIHDIKSGLRLPTIVLSTDANWTSTTQMHHSTKCSRKRKLCSRIVGTWIGDFMLFLSSKLAMCKNVFMIQSGLIL